MKKTLFYPLAFFFHTEDPLVNFELQIPWQSENYYSLLGNCKYLGLYI